MRRSANSLGLEDTLTYIKMGDLYLCDYFPVEILDMIWTMLPLRTRATSTKANYLDGYKQLHSNIPRFQKYVEFVMRSSIDTSFVFELLLQNKYMSWVSLGRWKDLVSPAHTTYSDYVSYLSHRAREMDRPKCLLAIQNIRETYSRSANPAKKTKRNRCVSRSKKSKKSEW